MKFLITLLTGILVSSFTYAATQPIEDSNTVYRSTTKTLKNRR